MQGGTFSLLIFSLFSLFYPYLVRWINWGIMSRHSLKPQSYWVVTAPHLLLFHLYILNVFYKLYKNNWISLCLQFSHWLLIYFIFGWCSESIKLPAKSRFLCLLRIFKPFLWNYNLLRWSSSSQRKKQKEWIFIKYLFHAGSQAR